MATIGRLAISRLLLTRGSRALPGTSTAVATRSMSQSWQQHGIPGSTFPFSIKNRYKLTVYFILFFGTAFNLPFIVVAHQLMKH